MILDFHHHGDISTEAVTSFSVEEEIPQGEGFISVGIHPWKEFSAMDFVILESRLADKRVVAIGESGLDRVRGADIEIQKRIFMVQAQMSEKHGLPLVIHAVKSTDLLIPIKNKFCPQMPWIIHSFRGKEILAEQLLRAGFYLSIGERFNPDAVRAIPDSRLLLETDTSSYSISQIITTIAAVRNQTPEELIRIVAQNAARLLSL
ncbi:MAG: TatD family hydrolase [Muribaculaceae bacterium]